MRDRITHTHYETHKNALWFGISFFFYFLLVFFLLFDGKVFVSHPQTLARNSLAPAFELVVFFFSTNFTKH